MLETIRVLFVDDEPMVLEALENRLRRYRHRWAMVFVDSAAAAISVLECTPFDVIVTDMRMPNQDGRALLEWVKEHAPSMGRIVLSGYTDRQSALACLGIAHLTLGKPCEIDALERGIECAGRFQHLLSHPTLKDVVGSTDRLPTLPRVSLELRTALADEHASIGTIAGIVERDPGLSAKLLQVINSPIFGLRRSVTSSREAVSYLGLDLLQDLMLALHTYSCFELPVGGRLTMQMHRDHSLRTARIAAAIAGREHAAAFSAGLLHDVGTLLLHAELPDLMNELYCASVVQGRPQHELEREAWGVTHADVGAFLLGLWGLPDSIVQSVALHHSPDRGPGSHLASLVAVADALAHEQTGHQSSAQTERSFHESPELLERLPHWRGQAARIMSEESARLEVRS